MSNIDITTMNTWIDSRALIRRREQLVWASSMGYAMTAAEEREIEVLEQFVKQGESIPNWASGTDVVADVGWEAYAQSIIKSQVFTTDEPNPGALFLWKHIHWKSVIDEMQEQFTDFTVVTLSMPYTFWVRN